MICPFNSKGKLGLPVGGGAGRFRDKSDFVLLGIALLEYYSVSAYVSLISCCSSHFSDISMAIRSLLKGELSG